MRHRDVEVLEVMIILGVMLMLVCAAKCQQIVITDLCDGPCKPELPISTRPVKWLPLPIPNEPLSGDLMRVDTQRTRSTINGIDVGIVTSGEVNAYMTGFEAGKQEGFHAGESKGLCMALHIFRRDMKYQHPERPSANCTKEEWSLQ